MQAGQARSGHGPQERTQGEHSPTRRGSRKLRFYVTALAAPALLASILVGVASPHTATAASNSSATKSAPGMLTPLPVKANPDQSSPTALSPLVSEDCQCSLSVDGLGTNNPAGGPIQVQKNAGATVKAAYLL